MHGTPRLADFGALSLSAMLGRVMGYSFRYLCKIPPFDVASSRDISRISEIYIEYPGFIGNFRDFKNALMTVILPVVIEPQGIFWARWDCFSGFSGIFSVCLLATLADSQNTINSVLKIGVQQAHKYLTSLAQKCLNKKNISKNKPTRPSRYIQREIDIK